MLELHSCLSFVNLFLTVTGQFLVMKGTLLNVFGSCERHSKLKNRDTWSSLLDSYLRKTLFFVEVSVYWATVRNWHTKVLDTWKVAQLILLHQESVNISVAQWYADHFKSGRSGYSMLSLVKSYH